jgi:endonuclease/exonuclease/phosphatase family metal-dependent hydrolase
MIRIYLLTIVLIFSSCDFFNTDIEQEGVVEYRANNIKDISVKTNLKIMTYNIKFGAGRIDMFFDCIGDRVNITKEEVNSNLANLASKIKEIDPDIIFLQEADRKSKRTAYIDQIQYLLNNTDLNYGVYASQWKADYVPSDGIGRVDSGNAILSKYPLKDSQMISLPLIAEQSAITQYFYLKRNMLIAKVKLAKDLYLINTHTSAYSHDGTKKRQLEIILSKAKEIGADNAVIVGGDFNTIPPYSGKVKDFADSVCVGEYEADNYEEESNWLDGFYSSLTPAISLNDYQNDNSPYLSHSVDKDIFWLKKLDYLFTNQNFSGGQVHQNTMTLSDHAPLSVDWSSK